MNKVKNLLLVLVCLSFMIVFAKIISKPQRTEVLQDVHATEIVDKLPAHFTAFYNRFHSDSFYQVSHIAFPLAGVRYLEDFGNIKTMWHGDEWVLHQPIDLHNGSFRATYEFTDELIEEQIEAPTIGFTMDRHFKKVDTTYMLTYYKEMSPR